MIAVSRLQARVVGKNCTMKIGIKKHLFIVRALNFGISWADRPSPYGKTTVLLYSTPRQSEYSQAWFPYNRNDRFCRRIFCQTIGTIIWKAQKHSCDCFKWSLRQKQLDHSDRTMFYPCAPIDPFTLVGAWWVIRTRITVNEWAKWGFSTISVELFNSNSRLFVE